MKHFNRTLSLIRIAFHRHQIHRYRLQGRKLMCASGQLVSPRLMELTRRVDHHGCLLHRLEREYTRSVPVA